MKWVVPKILKTMCNVLLWEKFLFLSRHFQKENKYDTVNVIYGIRYQKSLKEKLEKLPKSYPSYGVTQPDELMIQSNFPDCFKNKPLLEAIKSIKFSLNNNRHVMISGNEFLGKI